VTSPTSFTFTSSVSASIGGVNGNCSLASALATGPTQDYLFFSSGEPEVFAFDLPLSSNSQTPAATDVIGEEYVQTSGMVVDNDSSEGQASSIYFATANDLYTPTCGSTASNCAVKLTQAGLN
jgi:hypothetical protein